MMIGISLALSQPGAAGSAAPSYSPEATALFGRMTNQPDAMRKGLIDTYIKGMVSAGIWAKLDTLEMWAAPDEQQATLCWKNPAYNGTKVGAPTFTVDRGYTGTGVNTSYIDSNLAANAAANYTRDVGSIHAYINAPGVAGNNSWVIGAASSAEIRLNPRNATDGSSARINSASGSAIGATSTNRAGFWSALRTASNSQVMRMNGGVWGSANAGASSAPVAENITVLRGSGNAVTDRVAMFAIGALSVAEDTALYALTLTYLTAVGAQ